MLRRNLHIFLALAVSAVVHLAIIGVGGRYTLSELGWTIQPGVAPRARQLTVVLEDPAADAKRPENDAARAAPPKGPVAVPTPPAEQSKPEPPKPPERLKSADTIGERSGSGIGTHRAEGDRPLQAREADNDQPFLSRDPRGPGRVGSDPSMSVSLPGQGGRGGTPGSAAAASAVATPPAPPAARPLPAPLVLLPRTPSLPQESKPAAYVGPLVVKPMSVAPHVEPATPNPAAPAEPLAPSASDATLPAPQTQPVRPPTPRPPDAATELARLPLPRIELRPQSLETEAPRERPSFALLALPPAPSVKVEGPRPTLPAPRSIDRPAPGPGTGDGRRPGANRPAADPAQESDSESDAFAKIGSYNARDGKLDPQFGRKVKTVRPKIPIVGQVDAFAMGKASVTLKVNIDAAGKVTKARVHKSSGSNEIDQPCVVAMYEWWFEPLRDKAGNAVPDAVLFTITFR